MMHDSYRTTDLIDDTRRAIFSDRVIASGGILGALLPLLIGFIHYLGVVHESFLYPYGLDYGEGVVWAQMREMVAGAGYGPIDTFPSLVFHYPPVYHLLTALLSSGVGMDELAAGRLLSGVATLSTAVVIGLITTHMAASQATGRFSWVCGLIAGVAIFSMMPVLHWSRFMRVDMLALFFGFAGVYFGLRALSQPRLIHLAGICFVAAVFTKQTSIAPAIAVYGTLVFLRPKTALTGMASGLVMAFAALGLAKWHFGSGFIKHIVLYNINTVQWGRLQWIVPMLVQHALFIAVAMWSLEGWARRRIDRNSNPGSKLAGSVRVPGNIADEQMAMIFAYLVLATVMLLTIVKSGSTYNYFMEWLCLVALLAGYATRGAVRLAFAEAGGKLTVVAILVPLAIGVQSLALPDTPQDSFQRTAARRVELDGLSRLITATDKPVISNDLVLLMRSGKRPLWEPFTFPELAAKGLWNDQPFIRKIERKEFAFFVTDDDSPRAVFQGYSPNIAAIITANYPVTRTTAGMTVSMPALPRSR